MILKLVLGLAVMALTETVNGIFRIRFLNKYVGRRRALLLSFLSGTLFVSVIIWIFVSWIRPQSVFESLVIGFFWMSGMVLYDVLIGRVVFRMSWEKIVQDFNPMQGNFLTVGMVLIFLLPWFIFLCHGM